ncbi:MAG: histidinol-phosphate transaminase [Cellulomonadaceae bacterium]
MLVPVSKRVDLRPEIDAMPPYVPGARLSPGAAAFKLSSNENPYPVLPAVLAAIVDAAQETNRYPDMYATELTEAIAARLGVGADQVVVGNGSVAVLQHILQAVVNPGDEVVFGWRSFEAYPIAVAVAGGTSVPVPLRTGADDDGASAGRLDLPAMAAAVTDRTKAILVCSPNNPTGPVVHSDELVTLLESVPRDVLVVLDEAYLEFIRDPQAPDGLALFAQYPNLVLLRTFSKAYGLAGLRVGYAVARRRIAAGVRSASTPFGVSHVAQQAALASLRVTDQLDAQVDALVAERDRIAAALAAQGWRLPVSQANFLWFGLGDATVQRAAEAASAGVLVRPFAGEGMRVSIGEPEAGDIFLRLAATWL